MLKRVIRSIAILICFAACVPAQAALQCVPYARSVSGIAIHGNAHTWWKQAEGAFPRGHRPVVGAVLVFRPTRAMPLGHVAVVGEIVDERHIKLDHANWSGPGVIEHEALAVDVSEAGDWSAVRVWFGPIEALGARTNPTFGFIYNSSPASAEVQVAASDHRPQQMDGQMAAAEFADVWAIRIDNVDAPHEGSVGTTAALSSDASNASLTGGA